MKFYSTRDNRTSYSLREVVLKGMPGDKGLFMPEQIPMLPGDFFETMMDLPAIAFEVASAFLKDDLSEQQVQSIVSSAISFDAPLVHLSDSIHVLELFHGPTLAFKDFGARFMSRLMSLLI